MRPGQPGGMKLLGQCSLTNQVVCASGECVHDCEPHGGRELGWDDMANGSELLINVVRTNKPKGLTGLAQKRDVARWRRSRIVSRRCRATGEQVEPNSSTGTRAERGKPVSLPPGKVSRKASRWGGGYGTREEAKAIR